MGWRGVSGLAAIAVVAMACGDDGSTGTSSTSGQGGGATGPGPGGSTSQGGSAGAPGAGGGGSGPGGGSPCSQAALSFAETEATEAHGRVLIPLTGLEDSGADICAGDCTIEMWVRGDVGAQAPIPSNVIMAEGVDETSSFSAWTASNIVLDRSVLGSANPVYGLGFNRRAPGIDEAVVVFATRSGTVNGENGEDVRHVLRGRIPVLDGAWHHIAVTRDAAARQNRIYVDGVLDVTSQGQPTGADLSLPSGTGLMTPFIVLAVEKHNFDNAYGFNGLIDEVRLWNVALDPTTLASQWETAVPSNAPGLAASFRFEENAGTTLSDDLGGAPANLASGTMGDGTWTTPGAPLACDR